MKNLLIDGRQLLFSLVRRPNGNNMQSDSPAPFTRTEILARCEYFTKTQLWPIGGVLHPEQWLENFQEHEQDHAVHLLGAFLYYSDTMVQQLFTAAFQSISTVQSQILGQRDYALTLSSSWRTFCDRAIITYVTGEIPSPTDSGFIFSRMARQILEFPENRILSPNETLRRLAGGFTNPVVFVDDFVGSGQQFINTWNRVYDVGNQRVSSFQKIAEISPTTQFYYCVPFCAQLGYDEIQKECPEVVISAAHLLTDRYNVLHPESFVWSDQLCPTAVDFIKAASLRAGIPDCGGEDIDDWQGFKKLGLAVAFQQTIPDATLGFFRWDRNNWKPLMRKT